MAERVRIATPENPDKPPVTVEDLKEKNKRQLDSAMSDDIAELQALGSDPELLKTEAEKYEQVKAEKAESKRPGVNASKPVTKVEEKASVQEDPFLDPSPLESPDSESANIQPTVGESTGIDDATNQNDIEKEELKKFTPEQQAVFQKAMNKEIAKRKAEADKAYKLQLEVEALKNVVTTVGKPPVVLPTNTQPVIPTYDANAPKFEDYFSKVKPDGTPFYDDPQGAYDSDKYQYFRAKERQAEGLKQWQDGLAKEEAEFKLTVKDYDAVCASPAANLINGNKLIMDAVANCPVGSRLDLLYHIIKSGPTVSRLMTINNPQTMLMEIGELRGRLKNRSNQPTKVVNVVKSPAVVKTKSDQLNTTPPARDMFDEDINSNNIAEEVEGMEWLQVKSRFR